MNEKKEIIVCRLPQNHPGGQRKVAGFMFGVSPQAVEVTSEEKEKIENDGYVFIITKGEQYKESMKNAKKKFGDKAEKQIKEDDEKKKEEEKDESIPLTKLTKVQIVGMLVEKGLEKDVDFHEDAKRGDLLKLLKSIS